MRSQKAQEYLRLIQQYLGASQDYNQALFHDVSTQELCKILGITSFTISQWRTKGVVSEFRKEGNSLYYRLCDVKKQIEEAGRAPSDSEAPNETEETEEAEDAEKAADAEYAEVSKEPLTPAKIGVELTPYRMGQARAISAAKEAFRDVILELADEAERFEKFELSSRYYKDFILYEESLKITFERKP